MHRRDDDTAAGEVVTHQVGEPLLACPVEGGGRLVEQPEPDGGRRQAGDGEAPALASREIGGREARHGAKADRFRGFGPGSGPGFQKVFQPEFQVFGERESDGFSASWWPR